MGQNERGSAVTRAAAAGGWSRSLCTPTRPTTHPTARVSMSPPSSLKGGASSSNFSSSQKMDRATGIGGEEGREGGEGRGDEWGNGEERRGEGEGGGGLTPPAGGPWSASGRESRVRGASRHEGPPAGNGGREGKASIENSSKTPRAAAGGAEAGAGGPRPGRAGGGGRRCPGAPPLPSGGLAQHQRGAGGRWRRPACSACPPPPCLSLSLPPSPSPTSTFPLSL